MHIALILTKTATFHPTDSCFGMPANPQTGEAHALLAFLSPSPYYICGHSTICTEEREKEHPYAWATSSCTANKPFRIAWGGGGMAQSPEALTKNHLEGKALSSNLVWQICRPSSVHIHTISHPLIGWVKRGMREEEVGMRVWGNQLIMFNT
jgi:hypothetical protein